MLHQVKEALRVKMANNVYITLVHDATNEDPWGPTGQQMDEVTRNFHSGHEEIMEELVLRLKQRNHSWRSCYKSLLVIDHLVRNIHDSLIPVISVLVPTLKQISQSFTCNEKGVDRGLSVRERSRKLVELLTDGESLREERQKAEVTRLKVTGGPISVGSANVPSSSSSSPGGRHRTTSYDDYDDASRFRNSAVATSGGRAASLREEQERRDMALAAKLQSEETSRAKARGETIPYLYEEEPVVRVGRVKAAAGSSGGSAAAVARHPGVHTQGLTQDEIDERIAIEMQRRLDAGEPLTPTLFQQHASPTQGQSLGRNSATSLFPDTTASPKNDVPVAATTARNNASIDSFFDFGSGGSEARSTAASAAPPAAVFDPFAASEPSPPQRHQPQQASGGGETDFFDSFIAQRKDQNRPTAPTNSTGSADMFSSQSNPKSSTSDGAAKTPGDAFEQQMRGLQGISTGSAHNRPTLDEVVGTRQPLW